MHLHVSAGACRLLTSLGTGPWRHSPAGLRAGAWAQRLCTRGPVLTCKPPSRLAGTSGGEDGGAAYDTRYYFQGSTTVSWAEPCAGCVLSPQPRDAAVSGNRNLAGGFREEEAVLARVALTQLSSLRGRRDTDMRGVDMHEDGVTRGATKTRRPRAPERQAAGSSCPRGCSALGTLSPDVGPRSGQDAPAASQAGWPQGAGGHAQSPGPSLHREDGVGGSTLTASPAWPGPVTTGPGAPCGAMYLQGGDGRGGGHVSGVLRAGRTGGEAFRGPLADRSWCSHPCVQSTPGAAGSPGAQVDPRGS